MLRALLVVFIALCVHRFFRIHTLTGMSVHNHPHHPGPCQQVEGIQPGSEDFQILSNGQTFISSGLRYSQMSSQCQDHFRRQGISGRIYLLQLPLPAPHSDRTQPPGGPTVQELTLPSTPLFHADSFAPHGLSVWENSETGRHVVFVVNHRVQTGPVDSRVEKFVYDPDHHALLHQATFTDPSMTLVNDVQATGEDSFYFTNCNYFQTEVATMIEILLELSLTTLVHFDGHSYTVVDSGLKSGNGVAMSMDKKAVYVSDMVSREILVYRRNHNNTLTRLQAYPVHTWPDNIQVDASTGHLFVACHPQPFQFFRYLEDVGSNQSPSQVLQLQVKDGEIASSREVLYDDGQLISASASAVLFEGTLVMGSVFDRLVTCQVHTPLFH